MNPGDRIAVLTGTTLLRKGSEKDVRAAVRLRLDAAHAELGDRGIHLPYPVDHYGADRWLTVCARPEQSLRVALYVRAALRSAFARRKADARIGIGIGSVEFLPEHGAASGGGAAYEASHEAFDETERGGRLAFRMRSSIRDPLQAEACHAVARSIDHAATWWTAGQACAVAQALLGLTQRETGAKWPERPISQQAVGQHLHRAGWAAVEAAISFYEQCLEGPGG